MSGINEKLDEKTFSNNIIEESKKKHKPFDTVDIQEKEGEKRIIITYTCWKTDCYSMISDICSVFYELFY